MNLALQSCTHKTGINTADTRHLKQIKYKSIDKETPSAESARVKASAQVRKFLSRAGRKGGKAGLGIPKNVSLDEQRAKIVLREVRAGRLDVAQGYAESLPAHSKGCPSFQRQPCSCSIAHARGIYAKARQEAGT